MSTVTSGIYEKMKLIIDRTVRDKHLTVYRSGPFFEVYLNDVLVGKVKGLSPLEMMPEGESGIADECIRLKNHVIALTDEEMVDIAWEISETAERRAALGAAKTP